MKPVFPGFSFGFFSAVTMLCLAFPNTGAAADEEEKKSEPPLPYEEIGGQRFWKRQAVWDRVRAESERLREEERLSTVGEVLKGLERRKTPEDVRPLSAPDPQVPSSEELVARLFRSIVVVCAVPPEKGGNIPFGTGFAVSPNVIVTNWHVVDQNKDSSFVVMDWDGRVLPVTEGLAADPDGDLAVLRIDDPGERIPALPLAEKLPPPATAVWQAGHSKQCWWMASDGIVNRYFMHSYSMDGGKKDRERPSIDVMLKATDGASGSPVVDCSGRVIGIYHWRHWDYDTAATWEIRVTRSDQDDDFNNKTEIKDRTVTFTRHFAIPVIRLRAMMGD